MTSARAEICPQISYALKLIDPAKIVDGWERLNFYVFETSEFLKRPAQYQVMTEKEYSALDKEVTYEAYNWISEKISVMKISPATDIANYDLINTLDGGLLINPLKIMKSKRQEDERC